MSFKSKNNFFENYLDETYKVYNNLDLKLLEKITSIIENKIRSNKSIFVCGNGGSASISNHFLCDFNKGIKNSSNKTFNPKVISLTNSVEMITAIGNDEKFKKIFSRQLENYVKNGDLLIVLSCSGKSQNIKDVLSFAKKKRLEVIKFFGFTNKNSLKKNEITFSLGSNNYGISEDIFQALMHMISQKIRSKFIRNFSFKSSRI